MFSKGRVFLFLTILILLISISANSETWKELLNEADSLYQSQDFHSAIVSAKKALALAEKQVGSEDTTVALILHRLGACYYYVTNYTEAESSWRRSLSIRVKTHGYNHIDVCKSLTSLAELYRAHGRYAEAEPLGEKALLTAEKILDPKHPLWSTILFNHATLLHYRGRYTKAEGLYKRALTVLAGASESEQPRAGKILRNLANLHCDQGRYTEAEPLYMKALAILEKALTPEHPHVAATLNDFALCYRNQGKYAEAEPLYLKGQGIVEKAYGPEHINVGIFLNNRAELYCDWGKFSDAEPLYERALSILETALGLNHVNVAANLNSFALLYRAEREYAKAEKLYRRALSIYKKALGANHPSIAKSLNNLASLYCDEGRYTEAESLCREALEITARGSGPEHPEAARSMVVLADIYGNYHKYQEQRLLYQQVLTIFKNALSPIHPEVAGVLEKLSEYHRLLDNGEASLDVSQSAFEIRLNNFRDNACVLSERDALTYCQFVHNSTNNYLSCFFDADVKNTAVLKRVSQIVFASKGQVSDVIFDRLKSLFPETDSTTVALAESLRYTRFQISQLFVSGPGDDTTGAYRRQLDSLGNLANELESKLARRSTSYRKQQDYKNVSADRIATLLPENSVLVEYLKYDYLQLKPDSTIRHYLVVVLNGEGETVVTDLGEASDIDALISNYREHMLRVSEPRHMPLKKDKEEYSEIARRLYGAVIRPVEDRISGRELVFIVPDGGLNLISFAGLIDDEGKYLIERYPIHYLSSGRDLIRLKDRKTSGQGLLAIGDPDYDASVEARLSAPGAPVLAAVDIGDKYRTRNVRSGCGDLRQLHIESLPGTRNEIELVVQQWTGSGTDSTVTFFGPQASEDRFKAEAPGKRVIHLATHGYFYEGRCNPKIGHLRFGLNREFIGENPLLLSGLLFAGSNLHGKGADSAGLEDGVLSAYEVSAMNLEGTDLVVLSACETGLGEVKQGEGVYGLRRAFQIVGARTVVSALWSVSDKTTTEMMSRLYSQSDKPLPQRIRDLQLAQIKKLRSEGFSDHPYNWAAFIALGDWK